MTDSKKVPIVVPDSSDRRVPVRAAAATGGLSCSFLIARCYAGSAGCKHLPNSRQRRCWSAGDRRARGELVAAACQITHGNGLADCPKLPEDIAQGLRQLQLGQNGRAPAAYGRAEGVSLLDQLVEQGQNVRRGESGHTRAAYLNSSLLDNFMYLVHYVIADFNYFVP